MNREETAQLLGLIALGDNRQISHETVAYWHGLLPDIRLEDATQAVAIHRRESTDYLQPAHIVQLVRTARRNRIDAANIVYEPIDGETTQQFLGRLSALARAAGDGRLDPRNIGLALEPGTTAPTEVEAVIEGRKSVRSALNVKCPFCNAGPRSACRVGRDATGKPGFVHPSRHAAARRAAFGAEAA